MAHDVFISYSSPDRAVAEAICGALESTNIQCWLAPRNVSVGKVWVEAIVDAIDESRIFLLVLSANSNSSPQVIREVERAASQDITIVPIRIDDTTMSKGMGFFISRHQWLNVRMPLRKQDLDELTRTVQQLLAEEKRRKTGMAVDTSAKEKKQPEEELARQARETAAKQEAEKASLARETEEAAREEAERLAKEKQEKEAREAAVLAQQLAEEARRAKEAEDQARKEAARIAREKEQRKAKEAAILARQKAEESRKAKASGEQARKESERIAREKKEKEAREAAILARQVKKVPRETAAGTKRLTKSAWFWTGLALLFISAMMMVALPIINIDKFDESQGGLTTGLGVMLLGVLPAVLGVFSLWRVFVRCNLDKSSWLRAGDAFFIIAALLPFVLLTIFSYGVNRITRTGNMLPEFSLSLPLLIGAFLCFIIPSVFALRRGLAQDIQPEAVKLSQIRGFWLRSILLAFALITPIVFAFLISLASDPEEAQTVGLGMMLIICTPLIFLSTYYLWRGVAKERVNRQKYMRLAGIFLSVAVILPFLLIAILLFGKPGSAPMRELMLPPALLASLPLMIMGIYFLRQGSDKSPLWSWSGIAVTGVIAGGVIVFGTIFRPVGLQPTPPENVTPASVSTPTMLPAQVVWKISLAFSENSTVILPIKEWANDIKTATKGEWQIEIHYNEQLASKDKALDGIKNGSFEGASIGSQVNGDKTPLMTVLQNPFLSPSDIPRQAQWLMAVAEYPAIAEELNKWNAQILFPICSPPYNFMGNIPIRTVNDFTGYKINCYNRGSQALAEFGAYSYNIPIQLLHSALQDSTLDSVCLPWSVSFVENGFESISKYATVGIDLIIDDMYLVISKDAWNELPDEWKKLCEDAATKAIATYDLAYSEKDAGFISLCRAKGIEIINFPQSEKDKLVAKAASVWSQWVQEMNAKGLPGQDVFDYAKAKRDEIMAGTVK
jgi:TRAP-type C4-dicarboxylate transport system substrate-binding protein/actin-related protein